VGLGPGEEVAQAVHEAHGAAGLAGGDRDLALASRHRRRLEAGRQRQVRLVDALRRDLEVQLEAVGLGLPRQREPAQSADPREGAGRVGELLRAHGALEVAGGAHERLALGQVPEVVLERVLGELVVALALRHRRVHQRAGGGGDEHPVVDAGLEPGLLELGQQLVLGLFRVLRLQREHVAAAAGVRVGHSHDHLVAELGPQVVVEVERAARDAVLALVADLRRDGELLDQVVDLPPLAVLGVGLQHHDRRGVLGKVGQRLAERGGALVVATAAAADDGARRREGRQPPGHRPFSISSMR
jgi:hypothetical protein